MTPDSCPAGTGVEARKAGVRGGITRTGTIIIPVPLTKRDRGLSENQAGHEETDHGLHPVAYFICFGFKVLI